MTVRTHGLLVQVALLLIVLYQGWQIHGLLRAQREEQAEMQKATAQLDEDVRVMERLRRACRIEQAGWRE